MKTFCITIIPLVFMVIIMGCSGGKEPVRTSSVTSYSLDLPPASENERAEYIRMIDSAINRVTTWFADKGYPETPKPFFTHVIVFGSAETAKKALAKAFATDTANIPDSFSGTVSDSTLFLISRELYRPIWEKFYPAWQWSDEETYLSLMVHEIAHSEHAFIARSQFGSEDAMGPEWFFEGLAMACAHQFPVGASGQPALNNEEILNYLTAKDSPRVSYPFYAQVVGSLMQRFSVKVLLEHARDNSFVKLLKEGIEVK